MLLHIGQLGFFEEAAIPDRLYYVSAYRVLEQEGLPAISNLLRREVQARGASILALDGLSAIEETAGSARDFKKFIHELQAQAAIADCAMLLLTGVGQSSAEHTLVDGVIELQTKLYGRHAERVLQVHKLRGSGYLRGEHSFRITDEGIVVYPRTEALLAHPSVPDKVTGPPISTGVAQLDRIMGGGFPQHSTALLVGPPGIGKTTLGLHFLSECNHDNPGLFFGFMRRPHDEFSVAEVLQSVLADAGHEVVTAVNGRQGLELLGKRRPDLVLLDFMMPIMDGPAMLKAMKEDAAYRNFPAVVMSSLPESAVAQAARGMYAAFLRKPVKLAAVTNVVKTVLGQHS
jgi:circadian clock protein KaiC